MPPWTPLATNSPQPKRNWTAPSAGLATAESEAALTGGQAARQARKALVTARDEADFIAARLTGLEARRNTASAALIAARRAVAIEWRNWQRSQAADYIDRVYVPALDQFVAAIRGVTAMAQALGHNRLQAIARDTVLRDPNDWERNPCNPRRSNWRNDPLSGRLYQQLMELRALVAPQLKGTRMGRHPRRWSRSMSSLFEQLMEVAADPVATRRLLARHQRLCGRRRIVG